MAAFSVPAQGARGEVGRLVPSRRRTLCLASGSALRLRRLPQCLSARSDVSRTVTDSEGALGAASLQRSASARSSQRTTGRLLTWLFGATLAASGASGVAQQVDEGAPATVFDDPTAAQSSVAFAAQPLAPVGEFHEALSQAVLTNPQVSAAYFEFEAAREAERAARGGFFPSVDLNAEWGRERRDTPLIRLGSYSRDATRFSITQMLFDGFATRDQVASLSHDKLANYYALRQASESIAFEAARAYLDTLRFQRLVEFAEDNYVVHRRIYERIAERARGGVSQGVDLQQAEARIALAESNLITEITNLHDVQVRFQRVIGSVPAGRLDMPELPDTRIPALREAALDTAYRQSPRINTAIENLRAAQEALNARNAPMLPRIDLRYRNELEHDTDGFEGRYDEEAIELVLNWNLFRGGADSARKREAWYRYNAALEARKEACINVRQDVMIAFNDIRALEQQVRLLERNLESQDRTRRAYEDQFDIGQRTLLDLLDSQNEFFDTQRAFLSARADLIVARAQTLANMGLLLASQALPELNAERIAQLQLDLERDPEDPNAQHMCPGELPLQPLTDREALLERLDARAREAEDISGAQGSRRW